MKVHSVSQADETEHMFRNNGAGPDAGGVTAHQPYSENRGLRQGPGADQRQDSIQTRQRRELAAELSASIAHELNQPLTAISLQAEVLLAQARRQRSQTDRGLPRHFEEGLRDVFEQAARAREIISSLRALVSGDPTSESDNIEISDLIERVCRMASGELQRRGVAVELDISPFLLPVHVHATQIEQVLFNLLFNGADAMKDTPAHRRRLLVQVYLEEDGQHVRLSVRDRGCGVSEANVERIFDRFYTTKTDGMGMGLAISRSIVESHGGRIWAEPAADAGTWMHMRLPIAATAAFTWMESGDRALSPELECVEL